MLGPERATYPIASGNGLGKASECLRVEAGVCPEGVVVEDRLPGQTIRGERAHPGVVVSPLVAGVARRRRLGLDPSPCRIASYLLHPVFAHRDELRRPPNLG